MCLYDNDILRIKCPWMVHHECSVTFWSFQLLLSASVLSLILDAVKLFMLQTFCQTLPSLSMRTTHTSEQALSAFPLRQHKLLNISNLLRQLSRGTFVSSVSPHMLKWWFPHYICHQTISPKLTVDKIQLKHLGQALKWRINGSKRKTALRQLAPETTL